MRLPGLAGEWEKPARIEVNAGGVRTYFWDLYVPHGISGGTAPCSLLGHSASTAPRAALGRIAHRGVSPMAVTYQYLEEAALMALADDVMNPKSTTSEIKKLTIPERVTLARAILELNDMLRDREKP